MDGRRDADGPLIGRLVAVLALALVVRAANLAVLAEQPLLNEQATWRGSDMEVNFAWSSRMLAGDLLCREQPHPLTGWMTDIAPRETWERWWGGVQVFHQAPLYAYSLAAMRGLVGDGFVPLALWQLGLGLLSVALVVLVTARSFGTTAATIAGAAAAAYGPFAFNETLFLRDTLAVTTSLAMLWALVRAEPGRPLGWLAAGFLFALALLTRETTLLFGPFVLGWIAYRLRGTGTTGVAMAAWLAGAIAGYAPVVARNVVVGAPPLSMSTRGVEGFVYGHAADGSPTDFVIPESAKRILPAADGRLGRAISLTLATHESPLAFVRYELAKVGALLASYESADNASWYYFVRRSPLLAMLPGFPVVLAIGLVGLVVATRRSDGDLLLRGYLLATAAGVMYAAVLSRYRLVAVAALLPYVGAAVAWSADRVRAGRIGAAAAAAFGALLLAIGSTRLYAETRAERSDRAIEYGMSAAWYQQHGFSDAAIAELVEGLASAHAAPGQPVLPAGYDKLAMGLVEIAAPAGRATEIAPHLEALAARFPRDRSLHVILATLYGRVLHDDAKAAEHQAMADRLADPSTL